MSAAVGDNMNHVPSFVGVEKGIFLKHGVDVKLKVLATGQQMSQALQAGEVQIIGSAYSNYPLAVERGMAAKGVVGLMGDRSGKYWDQSVTIWTRKGTGITKIEELAGRKLGTPAGGTADEYLGVVLMKKECRARSWKCSMSRPATSSPLSRAGAWTPWPAGSRSPRRSRAKIPDAVLLSRGGGYIGYFINMAVRNDIIEKQPELIEKYVIGMAEATWQTRKSPDEAAEISTRWIPGLEVAVAKKALMQMVFDARITPHTVAAWDENVKILLEQKKLKSAIPWQQGLELRFIEKVMKTNPQLFADLKPAR